MPGDKLAELALFASNASSRADVLSRKPDDGRTTLAGLVMSFGSFHILPYQRLLLEGDRPVRLGSRAFDILTALVERAGEVVSKQELVARAWPQTFVEEANLKIQVSALRRALGDGQAGHRYIVTVPGRGYSFVARVRREDPCQPRRADRLADLVAKSFVEALDLYREIGATGHAERLVREIAARGGDSNYARE